MTIKCRALIFASFLIFLASCPDGNRSNVTLFNYRDFGPQAIAYEVIGMEWWQWQNHGDSRPSRYDVKVVVHKKSLDEAKKKYPVNPQKKQDFRYLECQKALRYLDEKIEENVIEGVSDRLKATRERIVSEFIEK